MATPNPFSLQARLRSFRYAFAGVGFMLRTQHNARIHLAATIIVLATSALLRISMTDWRWIIVASVTVWVAEAFNTALEHLCDVVSPGYRVAVKHAKDVAAAAVLLSAIGALCIGVLTLFPYVRPR